MKEKLSTQKAFYLYAVILGFLFVFYLAALHFSSGEGEQVVPPQQAEAEAGEKPVEEVRDQVRFYEELPKPLDTESEADTKTASATRTGKQESTDTPPSPAADRDSAPAAADTRETTGRYTIQVGAFSTEKEARQMIVRLRTRNIQGRILPPFDDADRFYRVWVGEFARREDARATENQLKQAGFPTYVRKIP